MGHRQIDQTTTALHRRLSMSQAIALGVASMVGAGVFAVFAPAAAAAGPGLILGLGIAAVIAYCNATSSAQLAAQYPVAGGAYVYGRRRLGPWPGFLAGWGFLVGKTASCSVMALTFATYSVPDQWVRPTAVIAVLALAAVNCLGVTRTAGLATIIVGLVLTVLVIVVVISWASADPQPSRVIDLPWAHGWYGILQSAGLLFFAFAGYARLATMGEEVRNPTRTIPRAIMTALLISLIVYTVIAFTLLSVLGADDLAASPAPILEAATTGAGDRIAPLVAIGAAAASLGALLALIAGVGRTALAMARHHDLPRVLAHIHPRHGVPHRAEILLALIVCGLILTLDLRAAIGFSSFGVLLYYFVANLSAFTQAEDARRYPRPVQVVGLLGCAVLVTTLPVSSILIGAGVMCVGVAYKVMADTSRRRWSTS